MPIYPLLCIIGSAALLMESKHAACAQDIYKTSNYQKKSDGPLPVKWLAIECIRDRVFSTQSDVWAFGIVLWEFFSLGKTPYPGLEAGDRFFDMLMNDYRMPQPLFAPREIYRIMSECWAREPAHRPRFRELADMLGDLLEAGEVDRYMDLGRRYESSDRRTGDILQWMASPDYQVDIDCFETCQLSFRSKDLKNEMRRQNQSE